MTDEPSRSFREVCAYTDRFDIADYTSRVFNAFSGIPQMVTIRCKNSLIEEMADRFGENTRFQASGSEHFVFSTALVVSDGRIGSLLNYGPVWAGMGGYGPELEVLSPAPLRDRLRVWLEETAALYGPESFDN